MKCPTCGTTKPNKITLKAKDILEICEFLSINNETKDEDELETEIVIETFPSNGVFEDDGKNIIKKGKVIVYFEELKDEGCIVIPE